MQKRHVIYMTDDEWREAVDRAARYEVSVSALIRALLVDNDERNLSEPLMIDSKLSYPAFNRRPFTPVPKKGK